MEKDRTYYQQVAEKYYLSHFAEIKEKIDKENAEIKEHLKATRKTLDIDDYVERYYMCVNVNTKDETCFIPNHHSYAVRPQELLFSCQMKDGKVETRFFQDGKDKVAEALGLVDLYDVNERIEVDYVRKKDGVLHLYLPEKLQRYSKDFYKVKLYDLDDFVNECNYTGWGDVFTCNVLEVIAGLLKENCIDFETNEIKNQLNYYVGPADEKDMNYYAEFDFSHCELVKDNKDQDSGWAVFICYTYNGLEEYENE